MSEATEELAQVLYAEGAYCGECEYQGWDSCSGCRQVVNGYVAAIEARFGPLLIETETPVWTHGGELPPDYRRLMSAWREVETAS